MPGPLAGIRVLELARILAGPWAGQILADLGADVIKIERTGAGDDTRGWGPPFVEGADGEQMSAAYYHSCNRGKRSVALDFETEDGRRIVKKLAARSDVVIENFKTGGLAKFGLDYAGLSKENPRLVYCSVTGFGQDGPYKHRAGYDLLVQGMGGIMDLTGQPDGEPMRGGVAFADVMTGIYSAAAINAALNERNTHRQGQLHRHGAARHAGRRAGQPGVELSGQRQGAEAHGQRASGRGAVSGVSGVGRPRDHRVRQRLAVRAIDRAARRARDGAGRALSHQRGTRGQSRHADPAHVRDDREESRAPTCWRSSKPLACPAGRSTRWKTCSPIRRCWRARCASICRASSPKAARSRACARRSPSTACA